MNLDASRWRAEVEGKDAFETSDPRLPIPRIYPVCDDVVVKILVFSSYQEPPVELFALSRFTDPFQSEQVVNYFLGEVSVAPNKLRLDKVLDGLGTRGAAQADVDSLLSLLIG